jgi:GT2 family glycosyltransferase
VQSGVPLVSYVLVNWRTEELLPRALDSIQAQSHRLREVVLVDNGSPAFDSRLLERYPDVKLLRNARNLGFAAANNQGISASSGDIIILLNCDAYLDSEFTRRAVAVLQANPRIGTVVPKILSDDLSGRIDSCGHIIYTDRTAANRGHGELDQGQYDRGGFIFGGTAAAIAYRREMLDELAEQRTRTAEGEHCEYFDESFFAYYEDVDLDWRAQLAGWQAYFEPRCVAWHRAHGSGGIRDWRIGLRSRKNRYLLLAKNDNCIGLASAAGPVLLYEAYSWLRSLLFPRQWGWWLLLLWHLPQAWTKRLRARKRRSVKSAEVARWFRPRGLQPPLRSAPPDEGTAMGDLVREVQAQGDESGAAGQQYPLVSVIVLDFDQLEITRACLASLGEQSYSPLEVILVDNGSITDHAALLGVEFPRIKTLRLAHNHGYSGGVNWGMTLVSGGLIALVNNDCILHSDCIRNLVYALRRSGAVAVSGRLVNVGAVELAELALQGLEAEFEREAGEPVVGVLPPELVAAFSESRNNNGRAIGLWHVTNLYGSHPECFDPSGGLCLLQRAVLEPLLPELFPHFYFAYGEDLLLGILLRARGGWVAKEPRAAAVHLHHATARHLGAFRLRYLRERNRMLNHLSCYPAWALWRLWPLLCLQSLGAGLVSLLRRPSHFWGWLLAQVWLVLHPGVVQRHRRRCRSLMQPPDERWLRELSARHGAGTGLMNLISGWWCRLQRIPHREAWVNEPPPRPGISGEENFTP